MPVFLLGSEGFLQYLKSSEIPQISAEINSCISDITAKFYTSNNYLNDDSDEQCLF